MDFSAAGSEFPALETAVVSGVNCKCGLSFHQALGFELCQ